MSSEYEKQLEQRNAELEVSVAKLSDELEKYKLGMIKSTNLTLKYDDWELVGLRTGSKLKDGYFTCNWVLILKKIEIKKSFFGKTLREKVTINEYKYNTQQNEIYYLNKSGNVSKPEQNAVGKIFFKCRSLQILDEKENDNKLFFRINDEEYKKYLC